MTTSCTGMATADGQLAGHGAQPAPPMVDARALQLRVQGLQAELASEQCQRRHLERAVAHARVELETARVELTGIRAGRQRAMHEALHDPLTSLPNRRHFRERLDQQLRPRPGTGGPAPAVMYIDLDAFKPVNDGYGHAVGDEVLKIIAARLAHAVRAEDLMSRLGGDEFACLLANGPEREQLREFAGKLLDIVAAPLTVAGHCFRVRPSIGVALAPADGQGADALIRSADIAMFHAKREQTGVTFFDELPSATHTAGAHPGAPHDAAPRCETVTSS